MIASGSMDCTVRLGLLHEDGRADTQSIGTHGSTVSALAVQYPNNNVLYSGGEDGRIIMNDIRQKSCTNLLACRQYSTNQRLEIASLVFDPLMPYQAAVASDEKFVRMYDVRRIDQCVDHFCPPHIALAPYKRRINGIAFSHSSELLVSYEWEKMYLFGKKMGLGHNPELLTDNFLEELDSPTLYTGHYNSNQNMGVTFFGLDDTLVGTGSQRGKFCVWRKKGGQLLTKVQADVDELMCVDRNPHFPMLCIGGTDVKIWSNEVYRERVDQSTSPILFNDDFSMPLGQAPSDLEVSDVSSSD